MRTNILLYLPGVILLGFLCIPCYSQLSFAPYQVLNTGAPPDVVAIGDVTGDGRADLVVGNGLDFSNVAYRLRVYPQDTAGTFTVTPATYRYTYANDTNVVYCELTSLIIADVNGDGRADIISGFSDSISICYQNAFGYMDAPVRYFSGSKVVSLRAGDLNGDGRADIAVGHDIAPYVRVFYQQSAGFRAKTFAAPDSSRAGELEIADLNGDGRLDVVMINGKTGGISVYTQAAGDSLNKYVSYSNPARLPIYGLAVGDLNGDGLADVAGSVSWNPPNAKVVLWLQDSSTHTLRTPQVLNAYNTPEPLEIADLDGDGKPEIITAAGGWKKLTVFPQINGAYSSYVNFGVLQASHYSPYGMSVGDITGDGKQDIALADYNDGIVILRNTSGSGGTQVPSIPESNTVLSIYPNPAVRAIEISGVPGAAPAVSAMIYNSIGTGSILHVTHSGMHLSADIDHYPAGAYFIVISAGGKNYPGRFVKE